MNNMRKMMILIFSIVSLGAIAAGEQPQTDDLELIKSKEMDLKLDMGQQTDNTRIYLEEGAIWASRDINKIEPEMKITVNSEVLIKDGKLEKEMNFNVKSNYGYYVKKWELSLYRSDDTKLMAPLKIISGTDLYNNMDIKWDGITDAYDLKAGKQLMFRLKAWDVDGNMDITTTGIVDLVKTKSESTLGSFEDDDENKRTFGQAILMKHNIPVNSGMIKFTGTNLVGVDKVVIGKELYNIEDEKLLAEEYLPTDRYLMPVKVIYKDGRVYKYEVYAEVPEQYYIHTGIADMYIGQNYVSKNQSVLEVDNQYNGDIYNSGRLAYFGMAKFSDKLKVTAQIDTREDEIKDLFEDIHKSDSSSVFERVDDEDEYYTTYGDESYIKREVNTQGKLYLNIDYDKSSYLWGNYNTGLTATKFSQYNRSLYGAKMDYKTRKTTDFGEDRLNVVGFASEPTTLSSHEEFLGTGGSLYFLQHGDVVEGSDKVAIKLIDKSSNITEDIIYLEEGRDYELSDYQGRIILMRPLSEISSESFDSIIKSNPSDGFENYLVVDYEYNPDDSDSLDNLTFGGRAKGWVNDYIGIGGTYVNEEKDTYDYEMKGIDLTLRATEGTYMTTEYSSSEGTEVDSNFVSYDGGLNFDKIDDFDRKDDSGDAFRLSGVLSLYDLSPELFSPYGNDVSVWYQNKDAEYSYASKDDNLSIESYGTQIRLRPSNKIQLKGSYSNTLEKDILDDEVTNSEEIQIQAEYAVTEKLVAGVEVEHIEELEDDELGKGDLLGAKIEYEIKDGTKVYTKIQTTLNSNDEYEDNDLYTVGGDIRVNDKLKLSGEGSVGDRGYYADTTLDYSVNDDYDVYVGYVLEDADDSDKNNVVFGQRAALTGKLDIYQENQFVDQNNGKGRTDSYGLDYEVNKNYKIGMSLQKGKLKESGETDIRREAVSIYQKVDFTKLTLKNKVEYKQDKGDETVDQYVTTNSFKYKYTDEYTMTGKINYSIAENNTTNQTEVEFTEGSIGLAYRPIYNDKINYLTKYTYFQDKEDDSDRDIDYNNEESHIFEFETIYAYNEKWEFGLKLAQKHKKEIFESESGNNYSIKSNIYLAGIKTTYHIMHEWDIFGEYHWKVDHYENDLEQGALVAINRHIGKNLKVGIGYNFSQFDDYLVKDDYDSHGWFINIVGKF